MDRRLGSRFFSTIRSFSVTWVTAEVGRWMHEPSCEASRRSTSVAAMRSYRACFSLVPRPVDQTFGARAEASFAKGRRDARLVIRSGS